MVTLRALLPLPLREGEGRGEGAHSAARFMESLGLRLRTRIGTMKRIARQRLGVRQSSAALERHGYLPRHRGVFPATLAQSKSRRGLPHSKTWRRFDRFMERRY